MELDTFPRAGRMCLSTPSRHWPNSLACRRRAGEAGGKESLAIIWGLKRRERQCSCTHYPSHPQSQVKREGSKGRTVAGAGSGLAFSSRLYSASVLELPVNQGHYCVQLNESHMTSPPLRGIPAAKAVECVTGAGAELARAG